MAFSCHTSGLVYFLVDDGDVVMKARERMLSRSGTYTSILHLLYGNETPVVRSAVASSGIPRKEIFCNKQSLDSDQGYDSTLRAFEKSMKAAGI